MTIVVWEEACLPALRRGKIQWEPTQYADRTCNRPAYFIWFGGVYYSGFWLAFVPAIVTALMILTIIIALIFGTCCEHEIHLLTASRTSRANEERRIREDEQQQRQEMAMLVHRELKHE